CAPGEGGPFVEGGAIRWPDGRLPVNTHGGQLSEAFIHGYNNLTEAVRQVRGTSSCQVAGAEGVFVAAAASDPYGALLLCRGADARDASAPPAGARHARVLGRVPAPRAAHPALRALCSGALRATSRVSLVRLAALRLVHRGWSRPRVQLDRRPSPHPAGVRSAPAVRGGPSPARRGTV